jgi:hypothetical protein
MPRTKVQYYLNNTALLNRSARKTLSSLIWTKNIGA